MDLLQLLSWMVFGLVAGGLAKLIMPGKDPGGCLVTILLGIAGALLGGLIATRLLGMGQVEGFNVRSLLLAVAGAVILLGIYRIIFGRTRRPAWTTEEEPGPARSEEQVPRPAGPEDESPAPPEAGGDS